MKIRLNGTEQILEDSMNLKDFVEQNLDKKDPTGVAVAINSMIVPKSKWDETDISENDSIEIVHAVQGG